MGFNGPMQLFYQYVLYTDCNVRLLSPSFSRRLMPRSDSLLSLLPVLPSLDPVPAFKSWQDESESGEAQLSPLAGRMVTLPPLLLLEEEDVGEGGQEASSSSSRSHAHLPARRFLDFGAHGAQRFLQQDPDATSPTKAQRYGAAAPSPLAAFRLWV